MARIANPNECRFEGTRAEVGSVSAAKALAAASIVVASTILLGALGLFSASAQQATITGGSWSVLAGSSGTAQITMLGIPGSGLGAADISVAFDPSVIKITACGTGALSGACNMNAPGGPAHAAGFALPAITGASAVIATISFDCVGAAGSSSPLNITLNELVDGTAGNPQPISASVQNGTVVCSAPPPPPPPPPPIAETPTPVPTPTPTPTPTPAPPPKIRVDAECLTESSREIVLSITLTGYPKGKNISLFLFPENRFLGAMKTGEGPVEFKAFVGTSFSRGRFISPGLHTITADVRDPVKGPRTTLFIPDCVTPEPSPTPIPIASGGADDSGGGVSWLAFILALAGAFVGGVVATYGSLYGRWRWMERKRRRDSIDRVSH